MKIDPQTSVCALIGDPVCHSLSPAIHNAAFAALELNYVYLAFRVEDCAGAIAGMRSFEQLKGLSVTIPHKISVYKYLDWIEDVATKVGFPEESRYGRRLPSFRGPKKRGTTPIHLLEEKPVWGQFKHP